MDHYLAVLKKYADFEGRSTRSEYWFFALFNFLIAFGLIIISKFVPPLIFLYGLYALAVLIPSIAVSVRRLHDSGRSGWWIFIALIPIIGGIWLLILFCQPSK